MEFGPWWWFSRCKEFEIDRSSIDALQFDDGGFGLGNLMVGKMVDRFSLAIS